VYDTGFGVNSGSTTSDAPAFISADAGVGPALVQLLTTPEIQPGSSPGYQLCKVIYSYHPLGAILADAPIRRAQSKAREISVPTLGEKRLAQQYNDTWNQLGKVGGTTILYNLFSASRIYGIASLAVGEVGRDPATELDVSKLGSRDLFFNILDPLNTAGSLVLNQDPNSEDFLKPKGVVHVNGQTWHPSRLFIKMHEQPLYIDWTSSAFGFVGRSVYQRSLYPLKTFVQSMITDQYVVQKCGLLIYKAESPGNFIDNIMQAFFGAKRSAIKQGVTGQVLSIGVNEEVETLNMQNLHTAYESARTNLLKNIASAAGMPASIIMQETLTEGFGEGTEDANKEIEYLEFIREDMDPAYAFLDAICRRKAWTKEFYDTLAPSGYPEYGEGGFDTALHDWIVKFKATWPNLHSEPESKKVEVEDVQMKSVIAIAEVLLPEVDPETKAKIAGWIADNVNKRDALFAAHLDIEEDKIETFAEESIETERESAQQEKLATSAREPRPFSATA